MKSYFGMAFNVESLLAEVAVWKLVCFLAGFVQFIYYYTKLKKGWGLGSVVEHLLEILRVLSSIPSISS